jgi:hypothetical protein
MRTDRQTVEDSVFCNIMWCPLINRTEESRDAYRVQVRKPYGRRPLGRPKRRRRNNTKMDVREVGWRGMDWVDLALNRGRWRALVKSVMNLRVPQNEVNFLSS